MIKNWKKELARDIIALGSLPFYGLVIIRAIIGEMRLMYHVVIALVILFLLAQIVKQANQHIARGVVLAIFISFFYQDTLFTIFAILLVGAMVFSLHHLKTKRSEIAWGVVFGAISTAVSYGVTSLIQ